MTDPAGANASQIADWNDAVGRKWVAMQERLDAMFAPLTQAAMALAAPSPGERVVDIGCGCGATVLELAAAVGPSGRVLGVDVSQPMLEAAAARTRDLTHVTLQHADAALHPFAPDSALVFSRFGVMFFDAPAAAFANMRGALAPGGRLVIAVWRGLAENPWAAVPLRAVASVLPPSPPSDPLAPGPFAFADPDRVRHILTEAGFATIEIAPHNTVIALPGTPAQAAGFTSQVGPAARALAGADAATMDIARDAIERELKTWQTPDGIRLGGAIWLVSARIA